MNPLERCELTELLKRECGHCLPTPSPERVPVTTVIEANYRGHCGSCEEPLEAGQPIGHNAEAGWVGMQCCGIRP